MFEINEIIMLDKNGFPTYIIEITKILISELTEKKPIESERRKIKYMKII